jgi:diguanylate cyclase (GGDEF)-like protein
MALERQIELIARSSDNEHHYGLILIDLVGLRKINAVFDRTTGDKVLVELAGRLRSLCPKACVARVEADKFAVLVDGLSQDATSAEGRRLKDEMNSASWRIDGKMVAVKVRVTCVSGPSPFPGETNLL